MGYLVTLLVGHRGTGKTTLLRQFQARRPEWRVYDLDEEVTHSTGESPAEILARSEPEFRGHERRVLEELVARAEVPTVISVGAGFEGPIPEGAHVIWVRRVTDGLGRVFLNRPRLAPEISPFEEYHERFAVREKRFEEWAHEQLVLPEGHNGELADFILPEFKSGASADLTLLPENFRDWTSFWSKRRDWGLRRLEVRDDLLNAEQIDQVKRTVPAERILYACREKRIPLPGLAYDWPVELGRPAAVPDVLSLHERESDLESLLREFTSIQARLYKLAIEIRDFHELRRCHRWWMEDPSRRVFLPRSESGRWRWYRSLFGPKMPLHYIREGEGSSADQPWLWQGELQPPLRQHFAAVLGHPVEHSLSPMEHREFFAGQGLPFVAIDVEENEFQEAIGVLHEIGLKFAAVTAPLKRVAAGICASLSAEASALRAVNTLFHDGGAWFGHNTDVLALQQLRSELDDFSSVWLWGGGGIKSSVKRVWPEAREISARLGCGEEGGPDLLIWAVGRSREFQWPPAQVRPRLVLDLNYGEDSPGLEWAVRNALPYQSGLRMFKLQAQAQREYWSAGRKS